MSRPIGGVRRATWGAAVGWAVSVYAFHKYGALAGWYLEWGWFQNLTHAASASGVALLAGLVGLALGYQDRRLLTVVVAVTAAGALGWEFVEYMGWMDRWGVHLYFHGFGDFAVDMASNVVGTVLALGVLRWRTGLRRWSGSDGAGHAGGSDPEVESDGRSRASG